MRLINADALYETLCHVWDRSDSEEFEQAVFKVIANAPIIDAIPVVRCKDCKNRNENCGMGEHRWCEIINMSTRADDYCSYGKRREP